MGAKVPCLEQRGMMKPIIKSGIEGFIEVAAGILAFFILGVLFGDFIPLETMIASIVVVVLGNMLYGLLRLNIADIFWRHISRVLLGGLTLYFIFVMVVALFWLLKPELFSFSMQNWEDAPVFNRISDFVALILAGMILGILYGWYGQNMIANFVLFRARGETAVSIENKGATLLLAPLMGILIFAQYYPAPNLLPAIIRGVLGWIVGIILLMQFKLHKTDGDDDEDINRQEEGMSHEHNL